MEKILILISTALWISVGVTGQRCPARWVERPEGESCYRFWPTRLMTWDDARTNCKQYGGDLLQLNSVEETKFVIAEINKYPKDYEWWIGLKRAQDSDDTWVWADGTNRNESNQYIVWGSGEPNNYRDTEDCGEIWDDLLNDKNCDITLQSICERPTDLPLKCNFDRGWHELLKPTDTDDMCYKVLPGTKSLAESLSVCEELEATLVSVVSEAQQEALSHYLDQEPVDSFWLAYTADTSTGVWKSNKVAPSKWWQDGTPDMTDVVTNNSQCSVLDKSVKGYQNWRPSLCNKTHGTVCTKPPGVCPGGFLQHRQTCYIFVSSGLSTWKDARGHCNLRGMTLLKIKSIEEQYVMQRMLRVHFSREIKTAWMDFANHEASDVWTWADEDGGAFGKFETDRAKGLKTDIPACGVIQRADGQWSTDDCGNVLPFVCTLPADVPPIAIDITGLQPRYECPPGFDVHDVWCYIRIPGEPMDWFSAQSACAQHGAQIVSIHSDSQQQYLASKIRDETWIYMNDRTKEGRYMWPTDASMQGRGYWLPGEPNNVVIGQRYSENCVAMTFNPGDPNHGRWADYPCNLKLGAMCQKKADYNIALGKVARQSSVYNHNGYLGSAKSAIDGCRFRNYDSLCCTHTQTELGPWWELDLGVAYEIGKVIIHRRYEETCPACKDRLGNFRLFVSNTSMSTDDQNLSYEDKTGTPQAIINIAFSEPKIGRYVRIDLANQRGILTLCEVQVIPYSESSREVLRSDNSNCITDSTQWNGKLSHTESGRECQKWALDTPHAHTRHNDNFIDGSVKEASNYCRDTRGEGQPWCYTIDPNVRWEHCAIPHCAVDTNGTTPPTVPSSTGNECKPGWSVDDNTGSCLYFGPTPLSWADADNVCVDKGARLFLPSSQQSLETLNVSPNKGSFWTGGFYDVASGSWMADQGKSVNQYLSDTIGRPTRPVCALVVIDDSDTARTTATALKQVSATDCLERHSYACATEALYTKYKTIGYSKALVLSIKSGQTVLKFTFKGHDGASILLTDKLRAGYEVKLGSLSASFIKDISANKKKMQNMFYNLYSEDSPQEFWISWANNALKVGTGTEEGRNILMEISISIEISSVSVRTRYGYNGEWNIQLDKPTKEDPKNKINLALNKPTKQLNTLPADFAASKNVVDGCTDGYHKNGCCTFSERVDEPWWEVDLGKTYPIKEVIVYRRTDCCPEKLRGFQLILSSVSDSTVPQDVAFTYPMSSPDVITVIPTPAKYARYVKIAIPRTENLDLCEVIVVKDQDVPLCGSGWFDYAPTNKCYRIMTVAMPYQNAKTICQEFGADLALPVSPEEQFFLFERLLPVPTNSDLAYYWTSQDIPKGNCEAWSLLSGNVTSVDCDTKRKVVCEKQELSTTSTTVSTTTTTMTTITSTVLTSTGIPAVLEQGDCKDGWLFNPELNSCYKIFSEKGIKFQYAWADCIRQSSKLTDIKNVNEQDFLKDLIRRQMPGGQGWDAVWVDGKRKEDGFEWFANSGQFNEHLRWKAGQPDNLYGKEDCVQILLRNDSEIGLLNDGNCNYSNDATKGYICKHELRKYFDCPAGWKYFENSCYYLTKKPEPWGKAVKTCYATRRSRPVSVSNRAEQEFLLYFVRQAGSHVYVGAHDVIEEGIWEWVDGTVWWSNIIWAPGQPDNWRTGEDCGMLRYPSGRMNDIGCLHNYRMICKMKAPSQETPTGTSTIASTTEFVLPSKWIGTTTVSTPSSSLCGGPGWEYYETLNQCYHVVKEYGTWMAARETCREMGGHLISIHGDIFHELVFIIKHIIKAFFQSDSGWPNAIWFGLSTIIAEDTWTWEDGTALQYFNWYKGEPKPLTFPGQRLCGVLTVQSKLDGIMGTWSSSRCSEKLVAVCKKPATVLSPTQMTTMQTSTQENTQLGCDAHGWHGYAGSCFLFVQEKVDWANALKRCHKQGAELASIHSISVWAFIAYEFPREHYCVDKHKNKTNCQFWADAGECDANPAWMLIHCHKTCGACIHDCKDLYTPASHCVDWEKLGECTVNPKFMTKYCAKSCGICEEEAPTRGYWIGLHRTHRSRTYTWADRSAVKLIPWDSKEPQMFMGAHGSCVAMNKKSGRWNDGKCTDLLTGYVCKKPMAVIKTTVVTGCDQGSYPYGSFCYLFVTTARSWPDAENYCAAKNNGSLTGIPDRYVQAFLTSEMSGSRKDLWIGLSLSNTTSEWTDHSALSFSHFSRQFENLQDRIGCVALSASKPYGLWNLHNCTDPLPFICRTLRSGFTTSSPPTTPSTPPGPPNCVNYDGWIALGSRGCFKPFAAKKTWNEAKFACHALGGYLLTILNDEEQAIIVSKSGLQRYWIGLSDTENEGTFTWDSGSPSYYRHWHNAEPNDFGDQEDCVESFKSGQWNDHACFIVRQYICEIDADKAPLDIQTTEELAECEGMPGWIEFENYCYYISGTKDPTAGSMPFRPPIADYYRHYDYGDYIYGYFQPPNVGMWNLARSWCQENNGDLVSIHSAAENAFITTLSLKQNFQQAWIGLSRKDGEGVFRWVDGSVVQYSNWRPGSEQGYADYVVLDQDGFWKSQESNYYYSSPFVCKKPKTGFNPTPIPTSPSNANTGNCPAEFTSFGDRCYYVSKDVYKYEDVSNHCDSIGATPISVHSLAENAFVKQLSGNISSWVWLGLTRNQSDDGALTPWEWSDGSPLDFSFWKPSEPNNDVDSKCVAIGVTGLPTYLWSAIHCDQTSVNVACYTHKDPLNPPQPSESGKCPNGYAFHENRCFKLVSSTQNFTESMDVCENEGGFLALPTNDSDELFLTTLLEGFTSAWMLTNDDECSSLVDGMVTNVTDCNDDLPVLCQYGARRPDIHTTTVAPSSTPDPTEGKYYCHTGDHVLVGTFCYTLVYQPGQKVQTYVLADTDPCMFKLMRLASIGSAKEETKLRESLIKLVSRLGVNVDVVLIGLAKGFDGAIRWVDKSPVTYTNLDRSQTAGMAAMQLQSKLWTFISWLNEEYYPYLCKGPAALNSTSAPSSTTERFVRPGTPLNPVTPAQGMTTHPPTTQYREQKWRQGKYDRSSAGNTKLTAGQIAGIVIGCLGALLILAAIVYIVYTGAINSAAYKIIHASSPSTGFDNALFEKNNDSVALTKQ